MAHILLIDDDSTLIRQQVSLAFAGEDHRLEVVDTGQAGVQSVQRSPPDVILLDLRLPDVSGLELHETIRSLDARIPVVFITVSKMADSAIEAMKQGAFDYLQKPLNLEQLRRVVGEAVEVTKRMRSPVLLAEASSDASADGAMLGSCPTMLQIYKAIGRVAAQDVTVLVTGESGTGKELVARAIYQHSARSKAPFFALNCAAIPDNLLESELFGHEKGAFTGADRRRIGRFEQCRGGTLFLDEIGDMPLPLQAKILRVLQEQTFERLGGTETLRADVRIIAATHRDLVARSSEEKFRSDLYYRLGAFTIHVPPLRERVDDLPVLVQHFIRRFNRELGRDVQHVSPEASELLRAYSWPGNIRELQNVLRQALLHVKGPTLHAALLTDMRAGTTASERREVQSTAAGPRERDAELTGLVRQLLASRPGSVYTDTHDHVDRIVLRIALEHTRGNQSEAASILGISRQTMRMKMRALGVQVGHSVEALEAVGLEEEA
jgi:DNA-binding NtrC family response regulator